jgi:hypothetical protein
MAVGGMLKYVIQETKKHRNMGTLLPYPVFANPLTDETFAGEFEAHAADDNGALPRASGAGGRVRAAARDTLLPPDPKRPQEAPGESASKRRKKHADSAHGHRLGRRSVDEESAPSVADANAPSVQAAEGNASGMQEALAPSMADASASEMPAALAPPVAASAPGMQAALAPRFVGPVAANASKAAAELAPPVAASAPGMQAALAPPVADASASETPAALAPSVAEANAPSAQAELAPSVAEANAPGAQAALAPSVADANASGTQAELASSVVANASNAVAEHASADVERAPPPPRDQVVSSVALPAASFVFPAGASRITVVVEFPAAASTRNFWIIPAGRFSAF